MNANKRTYDAVIFDCDGVLIDSEPIYNRVFAELLTENGIATTTEECIARYMGMDLTHCIKLIEKEFNTTLSPTLLSDYQTRSFKAFETELASIPDVDSIIDSLDCPIAVASSSGHEELRFTLGLVDLYQHFNGCVYSVEDVDRGKPYPDVYLHAAEQIGVEPGRCAVIEDSVNGANAGIAAGMTVFGFAGLTDAESLSNTGAQVFEQMNELHSLLISQMRDR